MKNQKKCFALLLSIFFLVNGNAQDQALSLATSADLSWASQSQTAYLKPKISDIVLTPMPEPLATATCFCKISYDDLSGKQSATNVCLDLTGTVNKSYTGVTPMQESNQVDCQTRCKNTTTALSSTQVQAIANAACDAGKPEMFIRSYSAVGTKNYRMAKSLGYLHNSPEVSQITCKCRAGWISNTSFQDGGVTADGKCYKAICGPMNTTQLPPNNTPIGTWGFVRGNLIIMWGTPANGGAPDCTKIVLFPKVCNIQ